MARSFTSQGAANLIQKHRDLISELQDIQEQISCYKSDIQQAANRLVTVEMLKVLKGIPIDEINRDKRGIKIKALKYYGYNTLADVANVGVYELASVYGISEDSAYTINRIVKGFVDQTRKNTKIRISSDNKTSASTQLISNIHLFRRTAPLQKQIKQLLQTYEEDINNAITDLAPGASSLRWFITSASKKQISENAYNYLSGLRNSEYEESVRRIKDNFEDAKEADSAEAWVDFQENSVRFFNLLEDICPGVLGTDDAVYGLPEDLAREIQDEAFFPDGLLCELRRYQEWGVKYILHQERVLLGDEMGLGKTVQAIASMVSLKNTGATHFVVVCPASVITNWCREIASKSKLRVTKVHGSGRAMALKSWIKTGGVAVTTYETTGYFKLEDDFNFSMLIVDEAHYIKNPDARRTINVKKIAEKSERLLFMTGTALENKVSEMVTLIEMLQPSIANRVRGMEFLASAPAFRKLVAPVYYRRKREDVLTELPELIDNKEWCTLSSREETVYEEAVINKHYAEARRVSWNIDDLRYSSKAKRMMEIIEEAESEGRKVIVFSFFLDTIRKVTMLLGDRCMNPINGSVNSARRQAIIDEFDRAPAGSVLAAQIQSGGTGLNIQSASIVIICEPQLKPSIENQAISRAYRMGQTRNVIVYRLLCENTVDERIVDILESKQAIFDAFADKSEAAKESLALDDKTFGDIIKAEIERINAKKGNI